MPSLCIRSEENGSHDLGPGIKITSPRTFLLADTELIPFPMSIAPSRSGSSATAPIYRVMEFLPRMAKSTLAVCDEPGRGSTKTQVGRKLCNLPTPQHPKPMD